MTDTFCAPATELPDEKLWQLSTEATGGTSIYSTDKYLLNQIAQQINKECDAEGEEDPPAQVLPMDQTTRNILARSIGEGEVMQINKLYLILPWRP